MNKKDLQSRRTFFKRAAQSSLPVLGVIALSHIPFAARAHEARSETGCSGSCYGDCYGNCSGACYTGCEYSCDSSCRGGCQNSCDGSCRGDCSGSCSWGSQSN